MREPYPAASMSSRLTRHTQPELGVYDSRSDTRFSSQDVAATLPEVGLQSTTLLSEFVTCTPMR